MAPRSHFQQDNARPYTVRVSQDCLHTVITLPWPVRCLVLSPIQHIWDHLGRLVGHPTSWNEREASVQQIWNEMSQSSYRTCMPQCPIASHRAFVLEGVQ
ncbi:transposable element Tcb2 transposase [Trichonephila clavipes]|nr:transposable element Tcb2 transposase [Trichonephila clavipes]